MRTILLVLLTALSPVAAFGAEAAPQTLDSVAQQIDEAWKKVNSYTATLNLDSSVPTKLITVNMKGKGPFEFMKVDGKPRYRSEVISSVDVGIPMPAEMSKQSILTVFDGTTVYTDMTVGPKRKVTKREPNAGTSRSPESGKALFDSLRQKGDLTLLPDAEVDGKPAFVVEVKPKEEQQGDAPVKIGGIRVYIAKENGIQVKSEILDTANKPFTTVHYTDIVLNVKLDPQRFVYTVPPGVTVEDMTKAKPSATSF